MGAGFGLIMAPSMATATQGVAPSDAGVASATVNAAQQVGGSIGTALLSTLFADAAAPSPRPAGTPAGLRGCRPRSTATRSRSGGPPGRSRPARS